MRAQSYNSVPIMIGLQQFLVPFIFVLAEKKVCGYSFGPWAIGYVSLIIWVRKQLFGIYQLFSEAATSRVQQVMASYIWKHKVIAPYQFE